jgi:hypothetical protein
MRRLALFWIIQLVSCGGAEDPQPIPIQVVDDQDKVDQDLVFATDEQLKTQEVVPSSYLVMFRSESGKTGLYFNSFSDEFGFHFADLQRSFMADPRVKSMDVLHATDLSRGSLETYQSDFLVPRTLKLAWQGTSETPITGVLTRVDFRNPEDAKITLKEWQEIGRVWYAEPNHLTKPKVAADACPKVDANTEGWARLCNQYIELQEGTGTWHKGIKLVEAFNFLATQSNAAESYKKASSDPAFRPIIAVMDSGVDIEHPSLRQRIWTNTAPGASGCDGDVHGCDTTEPDPGSLGNGNVWPVGTSGYGKPCDTIKKCSHGTHVAGIMAAVPNTSGARENIGGVCPVCALMVIKVTSVEDGDEGPDAKIRDDSQIRGFKYVTRFRKGSDQAVRVVNSSFGQYNRSKSIALLVDALGRIGNGTIVVGAAGNEDSMIRTYPAALSNVLAVSSLDNEGKKSPFSNFGPWVDIAAPGSEIKSSVPGGGTEPSSGTSMASPVVAGSLGLYLAANPGASVDTMRTMLLQSADGSIYKPAENGGFNYAYYFPLVSGETARRPLLGAGRVDVSSLIQNKANSSAVSPPVDRVTPGCATIGLQVGYGSFKILAIMLLFPFVAVFRRWF